MTPYSGRFAGYKIDKGKLSVDLSYKVDQRKLDAEQHFVIDQLQLGDAVESPDAVHLPLKLAIALLKDRNGVIDLPLPITGSLDDPQFKVGPIIWHALVNLLEKAVTAPFAAIGRLFGGHGEEMKFIDFAPGSADLDAASKAEARRAHEGPAGAQPTPARRADRVLAGPRRPGARQTETQPEAHRPRARRQVRRRNRRRHKRRANKHQTNRWPTRRRPAVRHSRRRRPAARRKGRQRNRFRASSGQQPAAGAAGPRPSQPAGTLPPAASRIPSRARQRHRAPPNGRRHPERQRTKKTPRPSRPRSPSSKTPSSARSRSRRSSLQALGKRRTRAIQDVLLADGGIDASRVFIINAPAKTDDKGNVRVEMALK